jgi:REP element-mobilizing transposase RayT
MARRRSDSSIYHIMLRGINQQSIFENDEDCARFLDILRTYQEQIKFDIYAYCLMGNHIHLLIKEGEEELSNTMKRIGIRYAYWYNWQYSRKGHLFQDRYRSEAVEDDVYLLTVLRYIHQNPIKAGLTKGIEQYAWSSYGEYIGEAEIVNVEFMLGMFDEDREKAVKKLITFHMETNNDKCLEVTEDRRTLPDKELRQFVINRYNMELASLQSQPLQTQREVLGVLKGLEGVSLRQLSRLTGFTVNKIFRS